MKWRPSHATGVPLETALVDSARDFSMPGGKLAIEIGRRLQAGEGLTQILQSSSAVLPPVYRAVIEAGMRSGRLPAALEGLAASTRRVAQLRTLARTAIMYPLVVARIGVRTVRVVDHALFNRWFRRPTRSSACRKTR